MNGYRLKVAVIESAYDLGSVPSLFGHPADYAKFLGIELSLVYKGNLLVVMPAGFGFYHDGRDDRREQTALLRVRVNGASSRTLVGSAIDGMQSLVGTVGPPTAIATSATASTSIVRTQYALLGHTPSGVRLRNDVFVGGRLLRSRSQIVRGDGPVAPGTFILSATIPTARSASPMSCLTPLVDGRAGARSCVSVHRR